MGPLSRGEEGRDRRADDGDEGAKEDECRERGGQRHLQDQQADED